MGNGLGFVAVVGVIYLGFKLWSLNYSVELIFSKDEPQTETKTKAGKEAFTCGDCNKKAVCSTCTQKAFNRIGHGLELIALVGIVYLFGKLWTSDYSIFSKSEISVCGDCNKKAVCSACTQKVCAVCKQKPCS
ncbi:hypothetical protein ACLB2K_057334 [Fragaria x ananassa]